MSRLIVHSHMRPITVIGCSAAIVLAAHCGDPMGCDPCRTTAVAHVFVRDSANQPIAGVDIDVRSFLEVCGLDFRGGSGPNRADSSGHRRILISSLYSPHTARCFLVIITPGSNANQPSDTAEFRASVEFRVHDGSPRDSARFNVVVARTTP